MRGGRCGGQASSHRSASQDDLNAFAKARRLQPPQTPQPKRGGRHADEKPEVTPQVRDHIAALRSILRPYARAFATRHDEATNEECHLIRITY